MVDALSMSEAPLVLGMLYCSSCRSCSRRSSRGLFGRSGRTLGGGSRGAVPFAANLPADRVPLLPWRLRPMARSSVEGIR